MVTPGQDGRLAWPGGSGQTGGLSYRQARRLAYPFFISPFYDVMLTVAALPKLMRDLDRQG